MNLFPHEVNDLAVCRPSGVRVVDNLFFLELILTSILDSIISYICSSGAIL